MPRVRKVSGAPVLIRGVGQFGRGDEEDVSADTAAYLCDERGDFELVDVDAGEDFDSMTKSELYDLAVEQDIDGRSTMDKDDLIEALEE